MSETNLTNDLLEAGMPPDLVEQWLVILRPRLDRVGRYRRSTGTPIATGEVARLVMEAEAKAAAPAQSHDVGMSRTNTPEPDLGALRQKIIAERARQAAQPRNIESVLQRLENPLGRIDAGR